MELLPSNSYQGTPFLKVFRYQISNKLVESVEQEHFLKTKDAICRASSGLGKTACILGVGAAQDIPLNELAYRFDKIYLVDIDIRRTKKAVEMQIPEALREKFHIEEADCTGIMNELSVKAEKIANKHSYHTDFVKEVIEMLPTLNKREESNYQKQKYSFVCSAMLASQLSGDVFGYLNALSKNEYHRPFIDPEKECPKIMDDICIKLQENHLEELSSLVEQKGTLYFADNFSCKIVVHCASEVKELGEVFFPGAQKLQDLVSQRFQIHSKENWVWSVPISKSLERMALIDEEGAQHPVDVAVTKFKEYQISSFVLKSLSSDSVL